MAEVNASVNAAYEALGLAPLDRGAPSAAAPPAGAAPSGEDRKLPRGSKDQVVVFDIDETALSNIVEFEGGPGSDSESGSGRGAGLQAGMATMAERGGASREEWDRFVASGDRPALAPTLGFYKVILTMERGPRSRGLRRPRKGGR
jgi:hypothetical protein